jgi:D-amino-acid dehydrogenase
MKIAIIGAGAVGVCTAHVLSKAGCEVHVYEQGSSAAQGASFSHGGLFGSNQVSPLFSTAYTALWAQAIMGKPKHMQWRKRVSISDYLNNVKALWQSRTSVHQSTSIALSQLATYSDEVRAKALSGKRMEYEQSNGLLTVHQSAALFDAASNAAISLNEHIGSSSKKIKLLSPAQAFEQEPALAQHASVAGAIYYPSEGYGNCALFTKQLKLRHQKKGVFYWFNKAVTQLEPSGTQWRIHTQERQGTIAADDAMDDSAPSDNGVYDAIVVAAGAGSVALLNSLNIHFPVLKTHAYTVTVPAGDAIDSPTSAVLDVASNNVIVPIGNRLRVSGQHQIGGNTTQQSMAYRSLGQTIQHWYPFASKVSEASYDCSSSCVAVDSKPIVGATAMPGLYVNFAHGSQAWPLAFGTAQALCDEILKADDRFKLDAFLPQRFK